MTKDFGFRHLTHSKRIKSGSKTKFYDAARKYGFDNFQIIILTENIEPYEKLKELEKYYIKLFNTYGDNSKGYNMTPGGDGTQLFGELNGMYEKTHTDKVKEKLSNINKQKTGEKNPWHRNNKTQEERLNRSKKSKESYYNNISKLSEEELLILKKERSERNKEAWKKSENKYKCLDALRYWEYKTDIELMEINKKKSNKGIKNGRSTNFLLISPKGESYIIENLSGLKNFCIKYNLVRNIIYRYRRDNSPIPPAHKNDTKYIRDKIYKISRDNTTGWIVNQYRSNGNEFNF